MRKCTADIKWSLSKEQQKNVHEFLWAQAKKNEIQTRMINLCVKIFNYNLLYQKLVIIVFDKLNNVYYIYTQCSLFFIYIVMHLFIMSYGLLLFFPLLPIIFCYVQNILIYINKMYSIFAIETAFLVIV